MSAVAPFNSTVAAMRTKVRRLTASASEAVLSTADIDRALNTFINQDFPYAIKIDQMRSVYTFFTEPYRDRYPIDVNYIQGVRSPFYVDGIQGTFFKDRQQFYNIWPRFPTQFQPISGDGITTNFSFTIPGPFLPHEVVLGGIDSSGNPISVNDDGNGNLQLQIPNPQISVPPQYNTPTIPITPTIPGMKNLNTGNPGLNYVDTTTLDSLAVPFPGGIGVVDYVSGAFEITFPTAPASGTVITLWVSQFQPGRPYSLLFWNNELSVRPVPRLIHKLEIEVFLTPVAFLESTDVPILNQWWQYISYGSSMEILRERQDMAGVEQLMEGFKRQEALVLERQGVEEIFQPNIQLFNSTNQVWGGVNGVGYY